MVRARFVIPVLEEDALRPRHWHLHVKLREQVAHELAEGKPTQIMFENEPDSDEVVDIPTLVDPNRPADAEGEPNPLPGPPEGWDDDAPNVERPDVEPEEPEDVVAPPPPPAESEEPDAPEPDPEPEPEPEAEQVPEGTIPEVKAWVGDDKGRAQAALEAEESGANRTTLIAWLEEQLS